MIEHARTLEAGYSDEQLAATIEHVREHVASIADADDDPTTRREDVVVLRRPGPDGTLTLVGMLDAEPDAPYLRPGYDPDAEQRPGFLAWTPADQPGWDPFDADPIEPEEQQP